MKDTLQTVSAVTHQTTNDALTLLANVDSFYASAWNKLVLVGSISIAIIGIVVPFLFQWYQRKSLQVSEEKLENSIKLQISNIKAEIIRTVQSELEEKLKDQEYKMNIIRDASIGGIYHIQGNNHFSNNYPVSAFEDYIKAAQCYLRAKDYMHLSTMLILLIKICPSITKEDIENLKTTADCDLEEFLNEIGVYDEKKIFTRSIRDLRLAIKSLPKHPKSE